MADALGDQAVEEMTNTADEKASPEEAEIFDSAHEHLAPREPQTPVAVDPLEMQPILEEPTAETAADAELEGEAIHEVCSISAAAK